MKIKQKKKQKKSCLLKCNNKYWPEYNDLFCFFFPWAMLVCWFLGIQSESIAHLLINSIDLHCKKQKMVHAFGSFLLVFFILYEIYSIISLYYLQHVDFCFFRCCFVMLMEFNNKHKENNNDIKTTKRKWIYVLFVY